MTNIKSVKFRFEIPSDCWENCENRRGILFAASCVLYRQQFKTCSKKI